MAPQHVYGDQKLVKYLREEGYHPRSPLHGSVSCLGLLDDLIHESDKFAEAARNGDIVYAEDYTVAEGSPSRWNTDLVVGPPAEDEDIEVQAELGSDGREMAEADPERVWLAIDAKSVMTEFQKARRNRQRDINSFADIMHRHHPGAVTGGLLMINAADRFYSPLRDEDDITEHDEIDRLVRETVEIFRDIDRAEGEISPNVDAVGTVVVRHDNLNQHPSKSAEDTELVTTPPAPREDDIVHYKSFVSTLLDTFVPRFLEGEVPNFQLRAELTDRLRDQAVDTGYLARVVSRKLGASTDERVTEDDIEEIRDVSEDLSEIADDLEDEALE